MFVGHYAVAFASKRIVPKVSLGTLFGAAVFLDLLWPILLLLGIEKAVIEPGNTAATPIAFTEYPYSHSFLFVLIWAALIGFFYFKKSGDRKAAIWVGGLVLSHWLLDLIMHQPDLPIYPSGPELGFGLWNFKVLTIVLELTLLVTGFALYKRMTQATIPFGRLGMWGLFLVLVILHFANMFGPPPPNIQAVAIAGNLQWLFVIFAFFVDRHRRVTSKKSPVGTIVAAT